MEEETCNSKSKQNCILRHITDTIQIVRKRKNARGHTTITKLYMRVAMIKEIDQVGCD